MTDMTAAEAIASIREATATIDRLLDTLPAMPAPELSHAATLRKLRAEKAARRPLPSWAKV